MLPKYGERCGDYELIDEISQGGMAEVFLARTTRLPGVERFVAVKRMKASAASSDSRAAMFLDEARLSVLLEHPNVVRTYDAGVQDGRFYLVLEYLHGHDLDTILRQAAMTDTPIPYQASLHLVSGVAAGLHYAHTLHDYAEQPLCIVHRDVTPHNLFALFDGRVKILDFGIASAADRLSHTTAGVVKGSCPYMSPEQCDSRPLDARSDLFSLGAVLFEVTTGCRLFRGTSAIDILHKIAGGEIARPSDVVPSYPSDLEDIVMRALAFDPDQRYPTALEMRLDLQAFARHHGLELGPEPLRDLLAQLFPSRAHPWHADPAPAYESSTTRLRRQRRQATGGQATSEMATAARLPSARRPSRPRGRSIHDTELDPRVSRPDGDDDEPPGAGETRTGGHGAPGSARQFG